MQPFTNVLEWRCLDQIRAPIQEWCVAYLPNRPSAAGGRSTVANGRHAKGIPDATVARLPVYLRALNQLAEQQIDTISSGALAEAAVNSAQLRKDLSYLGSYGTRGSVTT